MYWIKDPKNDKPSVSLTIFVLSTLMYVGSIIANWAGVDVAVGLVQQFWFGAAGLYGGRRLKFSKDGSETQIGKEKK